MRCAHSHSALHLAHEQRRRSQQREGPEAPQEDELDAYLRDTEVAGAEALLAEATAAAATEVAAAVDCPGTATEAAALRALSYSGFVGAAWRLFGRRAPRLAVLVRGNLSTRGLQYRAATLGWLKLQNSNSQRLVTHKKPSYRQARERRGDRKLQ